jgi:hypothetical protein
MSSATNTGVAAGASIPHKLAPRAMSLGVANALDYALPRYRIAWLI